jgi:hypothetical protein
VLSFITKPNGHPGVAWGEADIPRLVDWRLVLAHLLKLSPIDPTPAGLTQLFRDSLNPAISGPPGASALSRPEARRTRRRRRTAVQSRANETNDGCA